MSNADQFSNRDGVLAALRRAMQHLVPPADILPSVWAEKNIRIPVGNAVPGPLNFNNAPFQRGMIDAIKEPGIRRITYQTAAQVGKTTIIQAITGYHIGHEPRSIMMAMPSQNDVTTYVATKLRPMLNETPEIYNKLAKSRGRDGVNNARLIQFVGGNLILAWFGSANTLRGRSAPITLADEIDGADVTPEGDPVELLLQRSASFGEQRLHIESSTPTIRGESRVEASFLAGDQRRYYVPCPDCGETQYMRWENVKWDGRHSQGVDDWEEDLGKEHKPETALYCCESCGSLWNDAKRIAAIRTAEDVGGGWRASKPFSGWASFHAPEILSTFRRLRDIVESYLGKINVSDIQSFINVSVGEAYELKGDRADPDSLMSRAQASDYTGGYAPRDCVYITAGVDAQMDRLEVEVVGWSADEQSWSIEYIVLWGDPQAGEVWNDLDALLEREYRHVSGKTIPISSACLDTGGTQGMTQAAIEYARGKTGRRLFAVKGVAGWGRAIVDKPQRKQSGKHARKVDLFLVGVDEAKLVVMRRLGIKEVGPGYCHIPNNRDADWFKQITSEKLTVKYLKGQPKREWTKPDRARNEALDCRVYALAALKAINPPLRRIAERLNAGAAVAVDVVPVVEKKPEQVQAKPLVEQAPEPADNSNIRNKRRVLGGGKKRGNFATNW